MMTEPMPEIISTRAQLLDLARRLRVRPDWHEPDEQALTARVAGQEFDNAMSPGEWFGLDGDRAELHVILHGMLDELDETGNFKIGAPIAVVNLATLFAWACGLEAETEVPPASDPGDIRMQATLKQLLEQADRIECKVRGQRTAQDRYDLPILTAQIEVLTRLLKAA